MHACGKGPDVAGHVLAYDQDLALVVPCEADALAQVDGVFGPVEAEVGQIPLQVLVEGTEVLDGHRGGGKIEVFFQEIVAALVIDHDATPRIGHACAR